MSLPAWHSDLEPGAMARAASWLRQARDAASTVVIAGHVSPDGDALGGVLALHLGLERFGLRSVPTVGEAPLKVPASLAELPGVDALLPPGALPSPDEVDLLITVDSASPERLGRVAAYLDAGVRTLVLDHHDTTTRFGDLRLVAPRAAASVQVVRALLAELDIPLDADIASALYVGLVTDTGRFGFPGTDRAVMELGGELIEAGAPHAELTARLYHNRSLGELRLLAIALERLTFVPEVALVHTHVTHDELAEVGLGLEALESVIDIVRTADLAEVALVLKPAAQGSWKGSLRSRGEVDVGAIAGLLGGGGHARASGFTATGEPQTIVARVTELLAGAADGS